MIFQIINNKNRKNKYKNKKKLKMIKASNLKIDLKNK